MPTLTARFLSAVSVENAQTPREVRSQLLPLPFDVDLYSAKKMIVKHCDP